MKKGISLIVLIITVLVIIILATAVIVNLAQTNIVNNANEATVKQDFKTMQEELTLYIADKYVEEKTNFDIATINATKESEVKKILKSSSKSKYIKYVIIQNGEIVILDTMQDPEKTWAMEALNATKIASGDIGNDTSEERYITTGLQCYLDATNENTFVGNVWNDISGNNQNAILNGCTYNDNKVAFDGVDDWANLGKQHYPNYTYEIIFDCNELESAYFLGNWQDGGGGILMSSTGLLQASTYVNDAYDMITVSEQFNSNTKYKVTYTSDGKECKLYINGELVQTTTPNGNIEMPNFMTITAIGSNPEKDSIDYTSFFNGNVYLVRIYDRVLNEAEVKQNYNFDNVKIGINDTIYKNIEVTDVLYEITSLEELEEFGNLVNNGDSFEGKYVELKSDINLSNVTSWTPIGTESNSFKGIFNGNNHAISNINVDNEDNYQGLFGNNAGIIENLTIESGTIKGTYKIGGIVGNNLGIISNCINKAVVEGTEYHIGGVCGYSSGNIQKCYNYGDCSAISTSLAGIAGRNDGDIKFCGNNGNLVGESYSVGGITGNFGGVGKISSCYNKGEVICNGVTGSNNSIVGGIVGTSTDSSSNKLKIQYCYNEGNVTGAGSIVGGIIGDINANLSSFTLNYCYNIGNIIAKAGNKSNNCYAGGIVGSTSSSSNVIIMYCYNTGSVSCLSGNKYPGGIVGYNASSVRACYVLSTLGVNIAGNTTTSCNTSGANGNVSSATMKSSSFIDSLGGATKWYLDGGYPKLIWQ